MVGGPPPPAGTQGGIRERNIVLDDDMEFAQGAVDIAIDEKKISCFPRHIGGGGLGLQSAIERRSPACEVPDYLIGGGQIEPITGIVRVESDRRSKALDGGLRISRNKCKVASEPMTGVRIGGREAHGAPQQRQIPP